MPALLAGDALGPTFMLAATAASPRVITGDLGAAGGRYATAYGAAFALGGADDALAPPAGGDTPAGDQGPAGAAPLLSSARR